MLKLFQNTCYVRLDPERLSIQHLPSGREFADRPVLAIEQGGKGGKILALGREAEACAGQEKVRLVNGFAHPRTLIADFTVAEQTLKAFLGKVLDRGWLASSPVLVIHPVPEMAGGLTQIEIRALAELGLGAGARRVFVWVGRKLTGMELEQLQFPPTGGQLLYPEAP